MSALKFAGALTIGCLLFINQPFKGEIHPKFKTAIESKTKKKWQLTP